MGIIIIIFISKYIINYGFRNNEEEMIYKYISKYISKYIDKYNI